MIAMSSQDIALLDRAHLYLDDYFSGRALLEELRGRLVFDVLQHHLAVNPEFSAYARRVAGDELDSPAILNSPLMPLLPSGLFKRRGVRIQSVSPERVIKRCLSSGTSGSISTIVRDESTLLNFMTSITASLPAVFDLERSADLSGIVLGPSTEEVGDLWFSYVISCLSLIMRTTYCEAGGAFDAEGAADAVRKCCADRQPYLLIGPPHRILDVCKLLKDETLPPSHSRTLVVSAGGWKTLQTQAISAPAFRATTMRALGISDESQVRDSFNMVELNTVLNECEHHHKHVPPWLIVQSRDPETNEVRSDGETGVLCFMDAGALSYPCFIMSEDFGRVDNSVCTCGRHGGTFEITRRMTRIEQRGCALKMTGAVGQRGTAGSERFFVSIFRDPQLVERMYEASEQQ
jgi:long-chain-fatty-acid---luciferin-component ligase